MFTLAPQKEGIGEEEEEIRHSGICISQFGEERHRFAVSGCQQCEEHTNYGATSFELLSHMICERSSKEALGHNAYLSLYNRV